MLLSLALGFSGMSSSGYRLATSELPSFSLLNAGPRPVGPCGRAAAIGVGAVPDHAQHHSRPPQDGRRFEFVFLAILIAGIWSLMSGLSLQACGFLHA